MLVTESMDSSIEASEERMGSSLVKLDLFRSSCEGPRPVLHLEEGVLREFVFDFDFIIIFI
jgi:hypothetical protein